VVVVDAGGVGYEVLISTTTAALLGEEGDLADLFVSTQVREDSFQLFGFARFEEKMLFGLLISVSGIGPKTALTALSALTASDFFSAVSTNDLARLTRVPGIGKKTAERLVVELKDKVESLRPVAGALTTPGGIRSNALEALVALGYNRQVAERALSDVSGDSVQDLIRNALQRLSNSR
jgi:Holliday junction DNA helicase RuvA